jgi:hypothetical protein
MIHPMKKGRRRRPARPFSDSTILSASTSRGIRQERAKTVNHQFDGMRKIARSESLFKAVVPSDHRGTGYEQLLRTS